MDTNPPGHLALAPSQRRRLAVLALMTAMIYLPLNRLMSGGVTPLQLPVPGR